MKRRIGELIVGGFEGTTVPGGFADLAKDGIVGGAILFSRNIESFEGVVELVRSLAALESPAPLWLSIDQEGGRVARLKAPFPELPPMRQLGAAAPEVAHKAGTILGRSLALIGFHQDYAPVLDVDSNPDNPVIGDRSFSNDPHAVAERGKAFIRGLQAAHVAACGKHFPGHGDTNSDSHLELPRLSHGLERLKEVELVPFEAAIESGVASIMTAHIVFEALDEAHPATLSEHVLRPILRERLGYDGVIVSDDLEMKAIADHYGIEDAVVRALRAGCDQVLICHQVELVARAHGAIIKAVEDGELSEDHVLEALARVGAMRDAYLKPPPNLSADKIAAKLPTGIQEELMRLLA